MSPSHAIKPSSPNKLREVVRALTDAKLSALIVELRFSTKLEQSVLAKALQETRRRKRLAEKAPQ